MSAVSEKPWSEILRLALAQHRAGHLAEAATLYQQVLAQNPRQADALRLLGVLAHQRGELESARKYLELALQVQPNSPEIQHALGLVWFDLGQPRQALAAYQAALRLRPHFPEAFYNLGNAHFALGERDAAALAYHQATEQLPGLAEAHYNLGLIAQDKGDLAGAIEHYKKALRCRPDYPEAHLNLGLAQQHLSKLPEAAAGFLQALALRPDYPEALLNLGTVRRQEKKLAEAEACLRRAIAFRPNEVSAHLNLALVLDDAGKLSDAEQALRSALALAPAHAETHSYLAGLLKRQNRLDEAVNHYRRAIALAPAFLATKIALVEVFISQDKLEEASALCHEILRADPENAEAWVFLGMVRFRQRRPEESLEPYRKALRINPANPDARLNLAIGELLLGDYRSGFRDYEARWKSKLSTAVKRSFAEPRWQGEDVTGKTVLLYAEQGLGDAIHFVRYAPFVARRGARVIVECPAPLKGLFQVIPGIAEVIAHGEALPRFDFQIPFLSLPVIFETTLGSIPNEVPYLHPPKSAVLRLPDAELPRLKVGLVWAGNPRHANDRTRSIALSLLSPLCTVPGVIFYSLQIGPACAQLAQHSGQRIHDLATQLEDFTLTAAATAQLDLVISVDTAVAHLAGALGRPVWVLLPAVTDWRWLLDRCDSPWYPTMRLFRQKQPGDWPTVIESVRSELTELAGRLTGNPPWPRHAQSHGATG